jgi:uncharacterized alpha-E superfamily protein
MLSRVADNLYWMSRYLERAEHAARLLSVKLESMIEQSYEEADASWTRVAAALTDDVSFASSADAFAITQRLTYDAANRSSMIVSIQMARDNARQLREQISSEMWEHLNRLYLRLAPTNLESIWTHQPARHFREVMESFHLFEGITFSTMRHGEGWHFIALGRYIERAQLLSRLLELHFGGPNAARLALLPAPKYAEWIVLLKSCTAFEAYTKVYTANIAPRRIAEFLLFDSEFPHSVRFAVDRVQDALGHVAPGAPPLRRAAAERLAGRLKASFDYGQIDDLMTGTFDQFLSNVTNQCEGIHDAVYDAYIGYGAETVL